MNILLLGSGGREHAIAWKIKQSPLCKNIFIAPGNSGTKLFGTNLSFSYNDFDAILKICLNEKINMVIVGPEEPLVNGIVDFLKSNEQLKNLIVIGPSKEAAQLEGSKAYAKKFMARHHIPTAEYREFTNQNYEDGLIYLQKHSLPIVLKADGLAAGKGVVICTNLADALNEFEAMIKNSKFGDASSRVVVEQFLEGIEMSVFAVTDGKDFVLLPDAKDYKRIGKGDTGLNTGGMGAISPVPFADLVFMDKVLEKIVKPTIAGFEKDQLPYQGFVFFGLIKIGDEPFVIEYNCRMGDPETEVVLPRLKNDLLEILIATAQNKLQDIVIEIDERYACTIVAVSGGYPENYQNGFEVTGLDKINSMHSILFHAGAKEQNDKIVTNGGRVLCVTSFGETLKEATGKSVEALEKISYTGKYFRDDIGYEFK